MTGRKTQWLVAVGLLLAGSGMAAALEGQGLFRQSEQREVPQGAQLRLEKTSYDFGNVSRRGGDLTHDFVVENAGTTPLVITRVITSCSCLWASFPKRPIPAGGRDVIRITYEPHKSDPGTFHKVIQVYSNSVGGRQLITVQGNSVDPTKM